LAVEERAQEVMQLSQVGMHEVVEPGLLLGLRPGRLRFGRAARRGGGGRGLGRRRGLVQVDNAAAEDEGQQQHRRHALEFGQSHGL
jgi:hypothetical protein